MMKLTFATKIYKGNLLADELLAAGIDPTTLHVETAPDGSFCHVTFNDLDEQIVRDTEAVHDATQLSTHERMQIVADSAKTDIEAIPNWATWTESETTTWIDNNVIDLASAKTAIRALAQMVIALRNKQWPDLEGS
jgi:hypothetical protein